MKLFTHDYIVINNNNYHKSFSFQFPHGHSLSNGKMQWVSAFRTGVEIYTGSAVRASLKRSMVWIGELSNFAIKKVVFKFSSPKICVLTFILD